MKQVTQKEFFEALYAVCTPVNDIMPSIVGSQYPYKQEWRNQKSKSAPLFGVTQGDKYYLNEKDAA